MSSLCSSRSSGSPRSRRSTAASSRPGTSRDTTKATPTSTSSATTTSSTSTWHLPCGIVSRVGLRLRRRAFGDDAFLVMAIVNRTPDSFYDKGATYGDDAALAAVDRAVVAGADIVDIGGVKAGPGDDVDTGEEIRRVAPFVGAVRRAHPDLVISVDTWRATVARACLDEGADVVNDAWGGVDPQIFAVVAAADAALVCTHAGG